jgi:hypothetical protein
MAPFQFMSSKHGQDFGPLNIATFWEWMTCEAASGPFPGIRIEHCLGNAIDLSLLQCAVWRREGVYSRTIPHLKGGR